MPWTNAFQKVVLDHVLGKSAYTMPTNWYAGLMTVAPNDTGTGFTEVTGGSYARVTVAAAGWNAATAGEPTVGDNVGAITFPAATADWGTVVAVGLWDASTAGNMRIWATVSPGKVVSNGDTVSIAAGAFDVKAGDTDDTF